MTRLGLSYQDVAAVNPGVIYASISGYGQTGPYAQQPAHDPQIQGMSGLMDINGEPDGPPTRVGFYIGDLVTPMFASTAILAALREKERTGEGTYLDVSMMDTLTSLMLMENLEEDLAAGIPCAPGTTVAAAQPASTRPATARSSLPPPATTSGAACVTRSARRTSSRTTGLPATRSDRRTPPPPAPKSRRASVK